MATLYVAVRSFDETYCGEFTKTGDDAQNYLNTLHGNSDMDLIICIPDDYLVFETNWDEKVGMRVAILVK